MDGLYTADADTLALDDGRTQVGYAALRSESLRLAAVLQREHVRVVATLGDNSVAWVILDLAARLAGAVHVPLPTFFTPSQMAHALQGAGCDALMVDAAVPPALINALGPREPFREVPVMGGVQRMVRLANEPVALPPGTAKVTFTSGSTGDPKGVCLGSTSLASVADGVAQALRPLQIRRHLCALPLSVLLENVAGIMAPLQERATCLVPSLATLGLRGSSDFDPAAFHRSVQAHRPESLILLPQMLRAWAGLLHATGERAPDSLKFVAVGGAAVGAGTLRAARAVGIPAFEGYGLSEGASVQTLNLPGIDRAGSAGRPLPHARVRVGAEGELEIAGSLFLGYVGSGEPPRTWWPTGDLGHIDADGFVHVAGRKKNLLITAFGRNVSPEWVETALRGHPAVRDAVVLGDGQPALGAVLWPVHPDAPDAALQAAVEATNGTLPDYARVGRWVRGAAPLAASSGLATANGRPKRDAVERMHANALQFEPLIQ